MAQTAKASEIAANLAEELKRRQSFLASPLAVTSTKNADGETLITVGTNVAKAAGALIRVEGQPSPLGKDILGNTGILFSPTLIRLGFEANAEQGDADEDDVNTLAQLCSIIAPCVQTGARVEVYQSATGDSPDEADLEDATKLVYTWDGNAAHGVIGNV